MRNLFIFIACILGFAHSCTKDNYITTVNTVYVRDTFIEVFFTCEPIKNWQKSQNFEANRIYGIALHDSLFSKYEFSNAYIGSKTTPSYKVLPYYNVVKGYSLKYFINRNSSIGEFVYIGYGDTTNLDLSEDMYWGTTLVFKKK